jgi:hypothetical protein
VASIMFAFFSCSSTILLSMLSSMTKRVILQILVCPILWIRSAAYFHQLVKRGR